MSSEDEIVYGIMTFNWQTGQGKVYVKGDLFLSNDVTRVDLVQDWIVYLEGILETMRKANEMESQELRQRAKVKGAKK